MYASAELSSLVKIRRSDMGLTQTDVSRLSGLSRATVNQVENGSIKDLSLTRTAKLLDVLGLTITFSPARPKWSADVTKKKMSATERAAKSASVSYTLNMPAADLQRAIVTGMPPSRFQPHVNAVLEDASVHLLAEMVEEAHAASGVGRGELWSTLRKLAQRFGSSREFWGVK